MVAIIQTIDHFKTLKITSAESTEIENDPAIMILYSLHLAFQLDENFKTEHQIDRYFIYGENQKMELLFKNTSHRDTFLRPFSEWLNPLLTRVQLKETLPLVGK